MSAVTDVAAGTEQAAPDRPRPPGILVAVRVELAKLTSQWPLRIALALCVVAPIAIAVAMRVESIRPADTLFGRWAGTTGFATALFTLSWAGAFGAPLLASLFAGDIFTSEDRQGTWDTILTRSCTRTRVFIGKAIAATLCVWAGFITFALVGIAASLAAVGTAPLVGLSGQLIPPGRALGLVLASWALSLLPATAFVALGLLLSVATRSGVIGVFGPLVVAILLQGLEGVVPGQIARAVLLSTPADAWHALFTSPVHAGPIVQGVVTSLAYTALFAGVAWHLVRRRDFAADAGVPGRRRTATLRAGIVVAAVAGLVAGLGSVGPTVLTARRLDNSVAATFGHLAEVRYQWQTGGRADTTIPWHAACDRGGVAQASGGTPASTGNAHSKGPGDDWECIVTDLRASDGAGATVLDVTLKANGCYEAQSPPDAVGALYISNSRGKSFINPLYAFDGCFGTS